MTDFEGSEDPCATGVRTGHHHWPTSADIVEYDSSVAADTPTLQQQQQHTQLLLPQQQQQQRSYKFPQKSGAPLATNSNANYGEKSATMAAAAAQKSAERNASAAKWKTRALYVFLACLLAVVVINLTLTLWFIRVTQFTSVIKIILYVIIRASILMIQRT